MGRTVRTNDPSPRRQPWRRPLAASSVSIFSESGRLPGILRITGARGSFLSYRRCGVEIYYVGYLLATPRAEREACLTLVSAERLQVEGGGLSAPATDSQDLGGLLYTQTSPSNLTTWGNIHMTGPNVIGAVHKPI